MIPQDALSKTIQDPVAAIRWLSNNGIRLAARGTFDEYIYSPLQSRYLFDYEWDLAIILDACRYDLAVNRGKNHSLDLNEPERVYSLGSHSADWIRRTFNSASECTLSKTVCITGNPYSNLIPKDKLNSLDEVWRYAWDDDLGTIPPRPLTDRTISTMRNHQADKYIVHYMQPHLPPLADSEYDAGGFQPRKAWEKGVPWECISEGEIDPEPIIKSYKKNLEPVLDEVELLLDNVDATNVIITADHGNYLGEHGQWGHPSLHMRPTVREVPWWETSATDEGTHSPTYYDKESEMSLEEKLASLGYK